MFFFFLNVDMSHKDTVLNVNTHISWRSSGTSTLILMKGVLTIGLFGFTGRNLSKVTISFSVASHAAYSMT